MKIFISWSGQQSHEVARILRDWLPLVLPSVQPWVSSEDIKKGARWLPELSKKLNDTSYGIICVVPGNSGEPWLNFEAGALSKSVNDSNVSPFLVGVSPAELSDPLTQFQATMYEKDDVWKLVNSLNSMNESGQVGPKTLNSNFELCWPGLCEKIDQLIAGLPPATPDTTSQISTKPPDTKRFLLKKEHIDILKILGDAGDTYLELELFAQRCRMNTTKTQYYLDTLEREGYVDGYTNVERGLMYGLKHRGREYLVENNLTR